MATIANIRSLKNGGVLAGRTSRSASLDLRRYNLVYGFNGSGKSTLSRILECLQAGARNARLPPDCAFEVEMSDGATISCPDELGGLERRVLCFNADFLEENLKWASGVANPVFYIGRDQAELVARLEALEPQLPLAIERAAAAQKAAKAADNNFGTFKRVLARTISDRLREPSRKYEAPQLLKDYLELRDTGITPLTDDQLDIAATTCALTSPPPAVGEVLPLPDLMSLIDNAVRLAAESPAVVMLAELERHPEMVTWVREGHEFHKEQRLDDCLYCGSSLTEERKATLDAALNDRLTALLVALSDTQDGLQAFGGALHAFRDSIPVTDALMLSVQNEYRAVTQVLATKVSELQDHVATAGSVVEDKRNMPTTLIDASAINRGAVAELMLDVQQGATSLNALIQRHNAEVNDFAANQQQSRRAVRTHYIALQLDEFRATEQTVATTAAAAEEAATATTDITRELESLRAQVRLHGPAAEKMNKLIRAYLGHAELTIATAAEGYEIHRHGKVVEGAPSEGEKTAIALCYFLSTLEADDRKLADLIVVVDDPISSLDTRALNYACSLLKSRLEGAAQLFVLTHNLQCMNEFKKAWKNQEETVAGERATAKFLFIDATLPAGATQRTSNIVRMSRLLREYDSEYHFLFQHVLKCEANVGGTDEHDYMMPNVMRRVLDIFLAFREPGSGGLAAKLKQVVEDNAQLDRARVLALDRLVQAESHSENLDDLIAFSSMTVEEVKAANSALLFLMESLDRAHLERLKRVCRLPADAAANAA